MAVSQIQLIINMFGLILSSYGCSVHAQHTSNQMWYTYSQTARINNHWGYMLDLNHRTSNFNKQNSILSAARVGLTCFSDRNHRISAGYAWFGSHFQDAPKNILVENRAWEQYQVFKQNKKTSSFHRVRVEQRWRELMPANGNIKGEIAFSLRPRYMYQHQGPILPTTLKRKFGVWWQGAGEIMLHAGDGIEKNYFDQLRIIGGIILMPTRKLNLAILYQYINQYRPATEQHNNIHTIRLTLLHQLDFSGKPKQTGNEPVNWDE